MAKSILDSILKYGNEDVVPTPYVNAGQPVSDVMANAGGSASTAGSYTADPNQGFISRTLLGERGFNPDGSLVQGASPLLTGIQSFSGLANAWLGKQQLDLAKESLATSRQQFAANFNNQAQLTNTRLEDRQRARVASNPNAYESVGSYLDRNRVQGV